MDKKLYKVELRSDEVQDILSRPPHALIRYGISIICLISLILLAGCFVFRYPDTIQGDIIITTENPPVGVVAKSTGYIEEFYKTDREWVEQGDLIAVMENTARTKDVLTIKTALLSINCIKDSTVCVDKDLFTYTYELGELQPAFSYLIKSMNNYNNFLLLNHIKQEKIFLTREIADRESYMNSLNTELMIKKRTAILAKSSYDREKSLFEKGVISKREIDAAEQNYLKLQQASQELESKIISLRIENSKIRNSIAKLNQEYWRNHNIYYSDLLTTYRDFMAEIEKWEQLYLLKAPQPGTVTFSSYLSKNQEIKVSDRIFTIIPEKKGDIIANMQIPPEGVNKVEPGQLVNIKVEGYPYLEYGILQGSVNTISLVADKNFYSIEVKLISGLSSTTGTDFKFTGQLNGIAEIVTENKSIAERIFSPLKYLWESSF